MKYGKSILRIVAIFCLAFFPQLPTIQAYSEYQSPPATFSSKINTILQHPDLNGVLTGISIREAETGDLLYSRQGNIKLRPASNLKLLTAAVALEVLGPDYRFSTEILTDGKLKKGVLHGNLYIKGKGDPTLMQEDLQALANSLKNKGIKKIQGNIIGDDQWYDHVRYSQDLIWSDQTYDYGGAISALTLSPDQDYDAGTIIIDVSPGKQKGDRVQFEIKPNTDYVKIDNQVKTVTKTNTEELTIRREYGSNQIVIQGKLPIDSAKTSMEVAVWEPTDYVLDLWAKALKDEGITWNGKVHSGIAAKSATTLMTQKSMPLQELLIPFMKLSNNIHGEMLVKEMGKVIHNEGSWDKGLEVMESTLADFRLDMEQINLRDGSGISDKNLLPANEITKLLYEIQNKDWYPIFEQAQPIAGEEERMIGGTLRNRLTEEPWKGKVIAKTGSLTGVSTLSGYVTNTNGKKFIFSIMMNNYIEGPMREIQDEICRVLIKNLN